MSQVPVHSNSVRDFRHHEYAQPPAPCTRIQFDRSAIGKSQRVRRIIPGTIGYQGPIHELGPGVLGVGIDVKNVDGVEVADCQRKVANVLGTSQFVIGGFLFPTEADRLAKKSAAEVEIRISLAESIRLAIRKPRHAERAAQAVSLPHEEVPEE